MDETMIIIFNIEFKEFKGQFICLGENTEKYITFLVSISKKKKKMKIQKKLQKSYPKN